MNRLGVVKEGRVGLDIESRSSGLDMGRMIMSLAEGTQKVQVYKGEGGILCGLPTAVQE